MTTRYNGFLIVDKPYGITSRKCVDIVRKTLGKVKAGHTGTLDPFATGVLTVAIGRATKLIPYVNQLDKEYLATLRFGLNTDTEDITGFIRPADIAANMPSLSDIHATLKEFVGTREQRIPDFSARKIQGRRSYRMARKKEIIPSKSKEVTISKLDIIVYQFPVLKFRVTCSTGTYIRALATDIGTALNIPATLTSLRRLRTGVWSLNSALPLEHLMNTENPRHLWNAYNRPMDSAVTYPEIVLNTSDSLRFRNAVPVSISVADQIHSSEIASYLKVYSEDKLFLGIGRIFHPGNSQTVLKIERLIDISS